MIPDRGVFVAGDQMDCATAALGQEHRAAVEPERVAEPARHGLHDIEIVQGAADVPEQVEQREQLLALPLERLDPGLEAGDLIGCRSR